MVWSQEVQTLVLVSLLALWQPTGKGASRQVSLLVPSQRVAAPQQALLPAPSQRPVKAALHR